MVLSRKVEEEIVIRDECGSLVARITLVLIDGNRARLGISSPSKYTIDRAEVDTKKQQLRAEGVPCKSR